MKSNLFDYIKWRGDLSVNQDGFNEVDGLILSRASYFPFESLMKEGETVTFDKVLLIGGESSKVGAPYVSNATVTAKVEKQGKAKKIIVFKYKNKTTYRKKQGHRQPYTRVIIESINA